MMESVKGERTDVIAKDAETSCKSHWKLGDLDQNRCTFKSVDATFSAWNIIALRDTVCVMW